MDAGIVQGDGSDPDGNGDVIDLSHDQVRLLVMSYRGGAFDARIRGVVTTGDMIDINRIMDEY